MFMAVVWTCFTCLCWVLFSVEVTSAVTPLPERLEMVGLDLNRKLKVQRRKLQTLTP